MRIAGIATLLALLIGWAAPLGDTGSTALTPLRHVDRTVSFSRTPGQRPQRILTLGGLVVRASCEKYAGGRYLQVAARSLIEGSARTLLLAGPALGGGRPRVFISRHFGPASGWYDVIGSTPGGRERGTLTYARGNGAMVMLSFEARQNRCRFDGLARYVP